MARKPRTVYKEQQYDLGDGVTVTIKYPADCKPAMLHNDRYAMVSTLADGLEGFEPRGRGYAMPHADNVVSIGSGPNRRMSPEEMAEAAAKLGIGGEERVEKRKPLSSEDVFREAGVNPAILGAIAAAAEAGSD